MADTMNAKEQVELLRRQYLQLFDPNRLSLPSDTALRLPEVQAQIHATMFAETDHAPPDRYQFRVLKRLIDHLQQVILDPEEDVWLSLCFFISRYCLHLLLFSHSGS